MHKLFSKTFLFFVESESIPSWILVSFFTINTFSWLFHNFMSHILLQNQHKDLSGYLASMNNCRTKRCMVWVFLRNIVVTVPLFAVFFFEKSYDVFSCSNNKTENALNACNRGKALILAFLMSYPTWFSLSPHMNR